MTDKHAYGARPEVQAFAGWLADHAHQLPIKLALKSTGFVPGGLRKNVTGLRQVWAEYIWKSKDMKVGDWPEAMAKLAGFRRDLRAAIQAQDNLAAFEVCCEILKWGGDRRPQAGARPFLRALAEEGRLIAYLTGAGAGFSLQTARLGSKLGVRKMNSMLTKVHALAADDGLPIYDSRVAAAIAALVEMWRRAAGLTEQPLPASLTFPAVASGRTVRQLFDAARTPGTLLYGGQHEERTARRWAEAKIRLGWLMQDVLARRPEMFGAAARTQSERMHAFEASLFMIGYDVACLKQP